MLKKMGNRLKNQKGFTLVELLAVIVILGIIAAIAVPSIGNIIEKSKFDAAKADAIQILNAAKLYTAAEGVPANSLNETSTELKEYIDAIENITKFTVSFTNGIPSLSDVTVKSGITYKDGKTVPTFNGTVSAISKMEYKDK
ncbi:type IV pilin protein [Bacillus tuaregi]|uniref:type IV pilin protein n=1 Tax=Bacillus tuaregi TaxID=1816695 RepID=UPI0008F86BE5|nr:prepilin-type N-terminal cleavage/methylation domain-containing protein [Bacillus tuaregi]